ncbi:histidine triad nucleotide-binding protein [Paenibacillaceae bacterium]|nr:histidine triad nucleotide-binding protein [Paenibacillaceae bacterium]
MDCIFCKIVEGAIPSKKAFENEHVLAFHDIQPQAPVHVLIIPKKHIATMNDFTDADGERLAEIFSTAKQLARELGVAESGYRLINNCNEEGGQVVYHWHLHLLGGKQLGSLISEK